MCVCVCVCVCVQHDWMCTHDIYMYVYVSMNLFIQYLNCTNRMRRKSILKRNLTALNLKYSFFLRVCDGNVKMFSFPDYLLKAGQRMSVYLDIHLHTNSDTQVGLNKCTLAFTYLSTCVGECTHACKEYCFKMNLELRWVIYSRYHTMTALYTTALLLTKPSSDDDSGFWHGFGAETSLPLAQIAPALSRDTTRLCQIVVTL